MNELVGKTIKRMWVAKDGSHLEIATDLAVWAYDAEGDCCSHSWIQDIFGASDIYGGKVLEVKDINMAIGTDQEQYYSKQIETSQGVCEIIYRNSSNGYYGGCLSNGSVWEGKFREELHELDSWDSNWTCYDPYSLGAKES